MINDLVILDDIKIPEERDKADYPGSEQLEFINRNKEEFFKLKSEISDLNYGQLLQKLSSEDIRRRINKTTIPHYWTFYKKPLKFEDIFIIFELVRKSKFNMTRINFCLIY